MGVFKKIGWFSVILVMVVLLSSAPALALRCGTKVIERGDSKQRVYRACGEPDYQDVIGVRYLGNSEVKIEIWYYDFGTQKFTQTLTFHGNRLVRIEAGDYGEKTFRK